MSNIIQFILNYPIIIILVLGGLFNVGVRAAQKAKEQRAKRAALAEIQRRKQEALRTGKPINEPVIVYDEPQKQQKPSPLDERKARIEALRQQRMEQLRAMREKRAGTSQASPKPASQPRVAPPAMKPPTPQPQRPQQPARRPEPKPQVPASSPRVIQRPAQRQRPAQPSQPRDIPQARPAPAAPPAPAASQSVIERGAIRGSAGTNVRQLLRDPKLVRQAIVAKEILDAPIGLRDQDSTPGSLFN